MVHLYTLKDIMRVLVPEAVVNVVPTTQQMFSREPWLFGIFPGLLLACCTAEIHFENLSCVTHVIRTPIARTRIEAKKKW